ncbi:MAG: GWxTD domain-containing protein [bacterium]
MRIKTLFLITIILFGISQHENLNAQRPWFNNPRIQGQDTFRNLFFHKLYIKPVERSDSVSVTLFTKVANDLLQFVLRDTLYTAQYELTVVIHNDKGESIAGQIKKSKIVSYTFMETNARNIFDRLRTDLLLMPGKYTLFIELLDSESRQPLRKNEQFQVPDIFSKSLATTDILFFHDQNDIIDEKHKPFPEFPVVHSLSDSSFWAEFFICSNNLHRTVRLTHTILDREAHPIISEAKDIFLESRIQQVKLNLNQDLTFGQYTLSIKLKSGTDESVLESPFYIRWKTHTTMLPSLAQAVETLQYIMESDQWNQLKQLPEKQQKEMIDKFWKERDPDPNTEENELEEEYYQRVNFASQNFASWQGDMDGWRTDRGRIYIVFGPPSDVERPSAPSGGQSSYEIWYYRNLQRRFIFLDKFGNEDYRLVSEE